MSPSETEGLRPATERRTPTSEALDSSIEEREVSQVGREPQVGPRVRLHEVGQLLHYGVSPTKEIDAKLVSNKQKLVGEGLPREKSSVS